MLGPPDSPASSPRAGGLHAHNALMPPIGCVCGGPATRGTENAYRGGCTVDTTTGGRAYVTCTTLRPRRPDGRRSRRRDRLLRGAGPSPTFLGKLILRV